MTPRFLDLENVIRIHLSMIERYGGEPSLRDPGLLHSAIAQAQTSFEGTPLHENLFEMAAAYLFHIVQNHPFVDGNKRTGAAAAIIFLALNDIEVEADEDGLADLTFGVARGEVGKDEIAAFFRSRAH